MYNKYSCSVTGWNLSLSQYGCTGYIVTGYDSNAPGPDVLLPSVTCAAQTSCHSDNYQEDLLDLMVSELWVHWLGPRINQTIMVTRVRYGWGHPPWLPGSWEHTLVSLGLLLPPSFRLGLWTLGISGPMQGTSCSLEAFSQEDAMLIFRGHRQMVWCVRDRSREAGRWGSKR